MCIRDSYAWDNGVTDGTAFTPTATTTYTVTGTDANNCTATDQVTVTVNPLPTVSAGADQAVCDGETVTLNSGGSAINTSLSFAGINSDQYAETNTASNVIFNGVNSFTVETWYKNPGVSSGNNSTIGNGGTIITTYKRRNGGDPYNNFNLNLVSNVNSSNIGHAGFLSLIHI